MRDLTEVRRRCAEFINTMADNRPNCDDAGVARLILEELDTHGNIKATTRPIAPVVSHERNALSAWRANSAGDLSWSLRQSYTEGLVTTRCMRLHSSHEMLPLTMSHLAA